MPILEDPALLFQKPEHPRVMDIFSRPHYYTNETEANQIVDDLLPDFMEDAEDEVIGINNDIEVFDDLFSTDKALDFKLFVVTEFVAFVRLECAPLLLMNDKQGRCEFDAVLFSKCCPITRSIGLHFVLNFEWDKVQLFLIILGQCAHVVL